MHTALLVVLLGATAGGVEFVEFEIGAAVVTSNDVDIQKPYRFNRVGEFIVYGTFASWANSAYASNIVITDGALTVKLDEISKTANIDGALNGYKLGYPVTITDNNIPGTTKIPYTIYIVSRDLIQYPIYSPRTSRGNINNGKSGGAVILSADEYFTLRNISGSGEAVTVATSGFDEQSDEFSVLDVPSAAYFNSFTQLFSPIAFIRDSHWDRTQRVSFILDSIIPSPSMMAWTSFAVVSPGWGSRRKKYNYVYTLQPQHLEYQLPIDSHGHADISIVVGNLQGRDSVVLALKDVNTKKSYEMTAYSKVHEEKVVWNSMTIDIVNVNAPEYVIRVQSGSPSTCFFLSMALLFVFLA